MPIHQLSRPQLYRAAPILALLAVLGGPAASPVLRAQAAPASSAQTPAGADTSTKAKAPTALQTVEVSDEASSAPTALPVTPVSSVHGVDETVQDTPRAITEISADQLKADPITSYDDFISYAPSVNFNTQQNSARAPSIRGAAGDVYQNGLWLSPARHPFEQSFYQGVDIVSGPAGVVFGPTANTSSYINYTTKQPYFDATHGEVDVTIGRLNSGGESYPDSSLVVDAGGPILRDKLGIRASFEDADGDHYFLKGIHQNAYDAYIALGWRPTSRISVDWNADFGNYNYQDTRGWNRVTQDLIDHRHYLTGTAVPIITGGPTGYYSAVVDRGGNVTGYITRLNQGGGVFLQGAAYTPAAVATSSNKIYGWVLDPTGTQRIAPNQDESNPGTDFGHTNEFITQERTTIDLGNAGSLVNRTNYQHYQTSLSGEGMFVWASKNDYVENRTEYNRSDSWQIAGRVLRDDSNTGVSVRYSQVDYLSGAPGGTIGFWSNAVDILGSEPIGLNGLFGTQVVNPSVGLTGLGGPVSTKFGSIWFGPLYPTSHAGIYSMPGVVSASVANSETIEPAFFTQHNFSLGNQWGLNLGARFTEVYANIDNPVQDPLVAKTVTNGASGRYTLPNYTASLTYKPIQRNTAYVTFGYEQAINGGGSQSGLVWDSSSGTTQPTLGTKNFHSVSQLEEVGDKIELVPGQLFATVDAYHQTRVLPIQVVNGVGTDSADLRVQGFEATLRYQPNRNLSAGLNYGYIDAIYLNYAASVEDPYGFVADNKTVFNLTSSAGILPVKNYNLSDLPHNDASAYVAYRFDNGFGVKVSGWLQSSQLYKIAENVIIHSQYDLDVALSYNRPRWFVQVDFLNVTSQLNFANAGVDSIDFLQPLDPFGARARFGYRF